MLGAGLVALLAVAGVTCSSCPKGFNMTNFDLCSGSIESSSWEDGRRECALRGGPFAVLAPSNIPSGTVSPEITLPLWALPKQVGLGRRSVDDCHVTPGCVLKELRCRGRVAKKVADGATCHEVVTDCRDDRCDVGKEEKCNDTWAADENDDCYKYKDHLLEPSLNIIFRRYEAMVSISNQHLLEDCWCILAKLNTINETNFVKASVLSDLRGEFPTRILFDRFTDVVGQGIFWCQCFDKWTGLMLRTDVYVTGSNVTTSPSCSELSVITGAERQRWCVYNTVGFPTTEPPSTAGVFSRDVENAVKNLDKALKDSSSSGGINTIVALRNLELTFKQVPLMRGFQVSYDGGALSALVLPRSIGVKADATTLSSVAQGDTAEDLARLPNVSAAVVLPEPAEVAFVVYKNHSAFQDGVHRVVSPVVEVFAVNVSHVDIVLKPLTVDADRRCAFWDVHTGSWNTSGCSLRLRGQENDVCRCDHLTTFAQIVSDTRYLTPLDESVLEVLSVAGCSLSLLGALGTLVATGLSREWRSRKSTLVLLHLTAAVALRDTLFLAAAAEGPRAPMAACVAVGVGLHYAELASSAWCVVAAALQVQRFSASVPGVGTHLVLRCAVVAWSVAALPVVALLVWRGDRGGYPSGTRFSPGLCFPRGIPLFSTVTLPLGVATLINVGVFAFLVRTLCGCSAETRRLQAVRHGGPGIRAKALKCVVLFFLLGLPWVFGMPSESRIMAYVFCITATPQGLFLFFFFVVSNRSVRSSCSLTLRRNVLRYWESRKMTSDYADTMNVIRN